MSTLIRGVVAGSGMIVGGGIWAFKGYRRDKKWWLYAGLGLAGVGAATIFVAWWMARAAEKALTTQPQLAPRQGGIVGVEHARDVFGVVFLFDR